MTNSKNNKPKKKMTKADWIGVVVGFFIASIIFQMGGFGFIPAFIIAYGSYWIVKKIAQSFLKEEKENPQESTVENSDEPEQQKTPKEATNTKPKKSKKWLLWTGIIIVVLIFISTLSNLPDEKDVEFI